MSEVDADSQGEAVRQVNTRYDERREAARAARELQARRRRRRQLLWTALGTVAVLAAAGLIVRAVVTNDDEPAAAQGTPRHVSKDGSGLAVGKGPVTVDLYIDYLCPYCKMLEEAVQGSLDDYVADGKITLVYHPIAILDQYSSNRYSSRAAAAAACAGSEGKMAEYTGALYAKQPAEGGDGPNDAQLITIGQSIGLGETFRKCVDEQTYLPWVTKITAKATGREGFEGTPWMLVNNKPIAVNPTDADQAKKALADAVNAPPEKKKPTSTAKPKNVSKDGSGLAVGKGPVTVDLYVDYLCPYCKMLDQVLQTTLDQQVAQGKVTLVYHPVAILDGQSTNQYSSRAAAAAACAANEGKISEYTKALFAKQPAEGGAGPDNAQLITTGRSIGLGDSFARCVTEQTFQSWVSNSTKKATEREGFRGTPWLLVNDKPVQANPSDANQAKKALTDAVNAAK